jgi:hypothetical protein
MELKNYEIIQTLHQSVRHLDICSLYLLIFLEMVKFFSKFCSENLPVGIKSHYIQLISIHVQHKPHFRNFILKKCQI